MFIRIGNVAFNPNLVDLVNFAESDKEGPIVNIYLTGDPNNPLTFIEEDADRFLDWWDSKADVYTL